MAVKHFYNCPTHGVFEAWSATCPSGQKCEGVAITFLRGLGIKSDRSKNIDKTSKGLAKEFKMTDIKTTREGESQTGYLTRNNTTPPVAPEQRPGDGVIWGGAGGMNMSAALAGQMARPVNNERVGLHPKAAGITAGPAVTQNYTGKL